MGGQRRRGVCRRRRRYAGLRRTVIGTVVFPVLDLPDGSRHGGLASDTALEQVAGDMVQSVEMVRHQGGALDWDFTM
jgi:hypothetical protein